MADKNIPGRSADVAVLLLDAADQLGLPASAVRTDSEGFVVDEEVVKKAGLSVDEDKGEVRQRAARKRGAKKAAPAKKVAEVKEADPTEGVGLTETPEPDENKE